LASKDYMSVISEFITKNMESLLLGVILLSITILIVFIIVNLKLSKIAKKYKELTEGVDGSNLEELLLNQWESLKNVQGEIIELKQSITQMKQDSHQMISKVYSRRYNAFPEMGSDLSFSVVFLNDKNSGVVITSIYGRDENRVYLKPIIEGKSSYSLSPEEKEIIVKAVSK
jgi:hypothetical protein